MVSTYYKMVKTTKRKKKLVVVPYLSLTIKH